MRTLLAGTNILAADGTYPYGRVQDDAIPGDGNGTLVNEILLGDVLVYFQKLMDYAGVTANGNAENEISGYQTLTALFAAVRAQAASTSQKGTVEHSTNAEMITGTSATLVPPVSAVANRMGGLITLTPIQIGLWDMDADRTKNVAHGLDATKIKTVTVFIKNDTDTLTSSILSQADNSDALEFDATNIIMKATLSDKFDNANYDGSTNRGYITIQYEQ